MKTEDESPDTSRPLPCGCREYLITEGEWRPMHVDGCGTATRRKIAKIMNAKSKAGEDILDAEVVGE